MILLGVLDATPLTRAVIACLESQGVSLAAWIIAPEDHAKSDDAEKIGLMKSDVFDAALCGKDRNFAMIRSSLQMAPKINAKQRWRDTR